MVASGLCHSDDHMATGDLPPGILPMAGGHEGAGIVAEVGPNTPGWEVGDHVVLSFLPGCGRCRWCASRHAEPVRPRRQRAHRLPARRQLPDVHRRPADRPGRRHLDVLRGHRRRRRVVRQDRQGPAARQGLPASAAASAPAGARRSTRPRPSPATPSSSWASAASASTPCRAPATPAPATSSPSTRSSSSGRRPRSSAPRTAFALDGRGRRVRPLGHQRPGRRLRHRHGRRAQDRARRARRSTPSARPAPSSSPASATSDEEVRVPAFELTLFQKRIQGALFGASSPSRDIPWMLDLYQTGQLTPRRADHERRTRSTTINEGYADMHAGKNIRGVLIHERLIDAAAEAPGQARTSSRRPRPMMKRQPTP